MQTLNLVIGDYDFDSEGHNVCNDEGYAIKIDAPKSVELSEEAHASALQLVQFERVNRGLNEDGTINEPPPVLN